MVVDERSALGAGLHGRFENEVSILSIPKFYIQGMLQENGTVISFEIVCKF